MELCGGRLARYVHQLRLPHDLGHLELETLGRLAVVVNSLAVEALIEVLACVFERGEFLALAAVAGHHQVCCMFHDLILTYCAVCVKRKVCTNNEICVVPNSVVTLEAHGHQKDRIGSGAVVAVVTEEAGGRKAVRYAQVPLLQKRLFRARFAAAPAGVPGAKKGEGGKMIPILQTQFVQVALPIMFSVLVAAWWQNKRVDDLKDTINKRLDGIEERLKNIQSRLENFAERIVRLETSKWQ